MGMIIVLSSSAQAAPTHTIDWVAHKQQKSDSHNSETGKSKIMVPADSETVEDLCPGSETSTFLLHPYMAEGAGGLSVVNFIRH